MHERKREPNLGTNKIISEKESLRVHVCECECGEENGYLCVLISHTYKFESSRAKPSRAFCMHSLYILCVVCTEYTIYLFIFVVLCSASPIF